MGSSITPWYRFEVCTARWPFLLPDLPGDILLSTGDHSINFSILLMGRSWQCASAASLQPVRFELARAPLSSRVLLAPCHNTNRHTPSFVQHANTCERAVTSTTLQDPLISESRRYIEAHAQFFCQCRCRRPGSTTPFRTRRFGSFRLVAPFSERAFSD